MFVLKVVLVLSAVLWNVASGGLIMYDTKSFLFEVMENDAIWAELLNIGIKIETCIVSTSARTVLHEMGMITVNIQKLCMAKEAIDYGSSNHQTVLEKFKSRRHRKKLIMSKNTEGDRYEDLLAKNEIADDEGAMNVSSMMASYKVENLQNDIAGASLSTDTEYEKPVDKTVVTISALQVLVHIISTHYEESDALEFGLSVIASAIKCHVLQIISIMLRAIDEETINDYKSEWYSDVWVSLELFIDKIAWLKETLAIESTLYREWENLMLHTNTNVLEPAMDELEFIRDLVDESLYSACEHSSHDQIAKILKFNSEIDRWTFPKGIRSIFNKSNKKLRNIFQAIPISTMEPKVWTSYLNKMVTYFKILINSPGFI
ncbi:Hypothetical protein CINCED_3A002049 [Cinara cedri]|uniref:Uncharacterized protein n=1 Tax=Cinara cedri TaxID=506608 RepID=A0A5E4NCG9_9HEMI|nr:Hypothetical protein CINCED_3A002049 [Cinara cedri]